MNLPVKQIIFAFLILVFPALAQPQEAAPVRLSKLADRLYEVLDGRGARGGAYLGDQAILLIDTKMDKQSVNQTLAALKQVSGKPVKYVINTHSDGDHVNGNQYMPEEVTFIAHENCRQELLRPTRDGKPSPWNNNELSRCLPSITFRDKMGLFLGSQKVELWYFGTGHTTGDIVVYFPEAKTAFLGDQFFGARPQLIHAYKGGNAFAHIATLEKMLATLDAVTFCSGHSEPADRNSILQHITQMKAMQEKVRSLVGQGKSLADIKPAFPDNEAALVETLYNELKR
jgi:cyclase